MTLASHVLQPELETEYCVKPEEIYDIIEHFCLGRRRLHLYGNDSTIRPGISVSYTVLMKYALQDLSSCPNWCSLNMRTDNKGYRVSEREGKPLG